MSLGDSILQTASIARCASVAGTAIDYIIFMRQRKRRCAAGHVWLAVQGMRAGTGTREQLGEAGAIPTGFPR
jgi:hypothetical protein